MIPNHAIHLWLAGDSIMVAYPDGQQIPIPSNEPQRLLTILRTIRKKNEPEDRWLAARKFVSAFSEDDVKRAGQNIRKNDSEKVERERRALMRRADKRQKVKEAEKLLAIIGL